MWMSFGSCGRCALFSGGICPRSEADTRSK
jgi:hypothetical protein